MPALSALVMVAGGVIIRLEGGKPAGFVLKTNAGSTVAVSEGGISANENESGGSGGLEKRKCRGQKRKRWQWRSWEEGPPLMKKSAVVVVSR